MALKAKHAHGSRKNLDVAINNKTIDNFDVLFLSGENENPAIGWIDKSGNPIIISPADDLATLEAQVETKLAGKASTEDISALENQIATKVGTEEISALEEQISAKVDASYVDEKVETVVNTEVETVVKKEVETKIEEKIKEIEAAYEVVEF